MNAHKANFANFTSLVLLTLLLFYLALDTSQVNGITLIIGIVLMTLNNGYLYKIRHQIILGYCITLLISIPLIKFSFEGFTDGNTEFFLVYSIMSIMNVVSIIFTTIDLVKTKKHVL